MKFVFRADASASKGVGHVMRLLPLAQEIIKRGHTAYFVGEISEVAWLSEKIELIGFEGVLDSPGDFIFSPRHDVLVLDSYMIALDENFVQKKLWKYMVVVADELTPHYEADLVIHPGVGGKWVESWSQTVLHGFDYVLIRDSLLNLGKKSSEIVRPTFIVLPGGTDAFGVSGLIVMALATLDLDFECYVPETAISQISDSRFKGFPLGNSMEKLLSLCTGVFATASTVSLEMIALRIPLAILSLTDNQNDYYDSLTGKGLAAPLGKFKTNATLTINSDVLEQFVKSNLKDFAEAQSSKPLIDGLGAQRVTSEILSRLYSLI